MPTPKTSSHPTKVNSPIMKSSLTVFFQKMPWLAFTALVAAYCLMYAPYGMENNDGGFILGLAHQVFVGENLYDKITYVRPPASPLLHSIVFYYPLSIAPIFFDRLFFFIQIATYSALSAMLAQRFFLWSQFYTSTIAGIIFVFSAHAFPPMGWHTVDGIYFSTIALFLFIYGVKNSNAILFFSALFSVLAAASKQPFYILPLVILSLSLIQKERARTFLKVLLFILASGALLAFIFSFFGSIAAMRSAISSQTSLKDLFSAGVLDYLKDFTRSRSIIATWPILAALYPLIARGKADSEFKTNALLAAIWLFLIVIAVFYCRLSNWAQPLYIFDSIFIITLLCSTTMFIRTRHEGWLTIVAMHAIGWAASISWGYLSAILYAAPSTITLAFFLQEKRETSTGNRFFAALILPASIVIFYIGHQFSYSLEEPVRSSLNTEDMARVSPSLKFIKATPQQLQLYIELDSQLRQIGNDTYVVLPNMPLAHILTSTANPIGIDWTLNAETGDNLQSLINQLDSSTDYAVIYRKAAPTPETSGKFGSSLTIYASKNWRLVKSSANFNIFENPHRTVRSRGIISTNQTATPKKEKTIPK